MAVLSVNRHVYVIYFTTAVKISENQLTLVVLHCLRLAKVVYQHVHSLPHHVTSARLLPVFHSCLKTHLFRRSFS